MWPFNHSGGTAVVASAPLAAPQPFDVANGMDDGELAAYKRTCDAIGLNSAVLTEAEILAFMRERKIQRYDLNAVGSYLSEKAGLDHRWVWRGLRAQDVREGIPGQYYNVRKGAWEGGMRRERYEHPVPLRVLGRVEQFVQRFGERVQFLVSDYAAPNPDPFIAVVPTESTNLMPIVFDVWDEPDFK